jgi:predicted negative regulator of RcsB-dependent stress response
MARRKPRRRGPQEPEEILGAAQQTLDYIRPYLKWLITAGVILALGFLGWGGYTYLKHSREANAQTALQQVRPQLNRPDQAPEAIKKLDALIQDYPSTKAAQVARLFKANLLYQNGKYADAAKTYEELRSAMGNQDPYGWDHFVTESLSYCYEAQGDYAKAAQTLKPLVDRVSGNYRTVLLSRLALLYDKAGNRPEADMVYQRLLSQTKNPALASYWKERLATSPKKAPPAPGQKKGPQRGP